MNLIQPLEEMSSKFWKQWLRSLFYQMKIATLNNKTHIYFTPYLCNKQIFDVLHFASNKNNFE